ncbi:MAG: alpha/beta fold hydrolase [Pseudomonadota bacterium]|nr:alpha/beta fold hydrolase [Pseudomonadota bacterium]
MSTAPARRETIRLTAPAEPALALQVQRPHAGALGDVVYVHGSTFGADLSIFCRFDGRSWADAMNAAGLTVWGFDFAGYGASERYRQDSALPVGRIDAAAAQLQRVVAEVRARSGGAQLNLVSHSWGAAVAARYAATCPQDVGALVLFAPITVRAADACAPTGYIPPAAACAPAHYRLTLWAQYRRFVEDVPRGRPQPLDEAHFQAWGEAFLATDPGAGKRMPPSVLTPGGPQADVQALWSGQALYDPACIAAPTLLVRGEWDTVCTGADAHQLLRALGSARKSAVTIERATHLVHLESQRGLLYNAVNTFLQRSAT